MMTAFVAFAAGLHRQALWQVVRACVADFKLTTAPYPCLAVNLWWRRAWLCRASTAIDA
jgi:hypothetical protein